MGGPVSVTVAARATADLPQGRKRGASAEAD